MRGILWLGTLLLCLPIASAQPLFIAYSPDVSQEEAFYGLATQGSVDDTHDWFGDSTCDFLVPCVCTDNETPWIVTLVVMTGTAEDQLMISGTGGSAVATLESPASVPTISSNGCESAYFVVEGTSVSKQAVYRVDVDCPETTLADLVPFFC